MVIVGEGRLLAHRLNCSEAIFQSLLLPSLPFCYAEITEMSGRKSRKREWDLAPSAPNRLARQDPGNAKVRLHEHGTRCQHFNSYPCLY